jgi:hypothetical protein
MQQFTSPEIESEQADMDESFTEEVVDLSTKNIEAEEGWFGSQTLDGEIRLSDEGRCNLERILGDLRTP